MDAPYQSQAVGRSGRARLAARFAGFLDRRAVESLVQFVVANRNGFTRSRVLQGESPDGVVNLEIRRSQVLSDIGEHEALFAARLGATLPQAAELLGLPAFSISRIEIQIGALHDGDYFGLHRDKSVDEFPSRAITFVYYFFCRPRRFSGGELRLYRDRFVETIVPEQNVLVMFRSSTLHEVLPVSCPSGSFEDGRFTVSGWLHRGDESASQP